MQPPFPTRNVIITGAGPAGMSLAYLLARRGIGVTVLESHQDFARSFRGEGLQKSGIDAFRQMGLGAGLDRIPFAEVKAIEIYQGGRLRVRANPAGLGRAQVRIVSQPDLLQMLADEASNFSNFRLETGVTVRDLLRENGRVAGVRASVGSAHREYRADLVIGADGRHAATRKHSGLAELSTPQDFDILWLKVPYPDDYPDHATAIFDLAPKRVVIVFPSADGRMQVGFIIPKGAFTDLRALGPDAWTETLIGYLPPFLARHLRLHRELLASTTLLNVVCGRLLEWTVPGLLLIGDAAHPMSPVGGQGVNLAIRDALVAANHLCPVLASGGDAAAIDAAAQNVAKERLPEIAASQKMQSDQAAMLFAPDSWRTRWMHRLLPIMAKTGLLQWLHRKEYTLMSEGVVPVKLVV